MRWNGDREAFLAEYRRRFGRVLNADNAAELFPEYASSLDTRARFRVAVHPAAQWIRDELFERALADPLVAEVIFTAGGNGAGKTSGAPDGEIVYDSTLNNVDHAQRCIEKCLGAGKSVVVAYDVSAHPRRFSRGTPSRRIGGSNRRRRYGDPNTYGVREDERLAGRAISRCTRGCFSLYRQ